MVGVLSLVLNDSNENNSKLDFNGMISPNPVHRTQSCLDKRNAPLIACCWTIAWMDYEGALISSKASC